jgi:deaminated glutathione amidase
VSAEDLTTSMQSLRNNRQALFLPEASDYIAGSGEESHRLVKSVKSSEFVRGLQHEAQQKSLAIHVGVHEPGEDRQRIKNTVLWINEQGEIAQRYQKIHLFDVEIKNGPILKESKWVHNCLCEKWTSIALTLCQRYVEAGKEIMPPFDTPVGKVASMICFDVIHS